MAILGEITHMTGRKGINGTISYMPQEAWIVSDTVRNNVLFGKEYVSQHYQTVMEACGLGTVR